MKDFEISNKTTGIVKGADYLGNCETRLARSQS